MMSNTRVFSSIITGVLVLVLVVKAQDVRGTPGVDYPNYDTIPKTSFSCSEQKYIPGLYADMETGCQVFHFCEENIKESFLCPPGMTFNQASLTCDSWDNFNCSLAPQFFSMNTGPEMDNARRNILMVLQLKNRSRSKLSNRPSDVYAKITSLYDGTVGEEQSELPDVAVGINAESNDGVNHGVVTEEMPEEALERSEENEHGFNQNLSGIDESTLNDESAYISEHSEPEIFYDPVTEKYYVDYDPLQTVNEVSKEEFDKVGSLSYDGFSERFGFSYNENVDDMQSDSESSYSKENDLEELHEMLAAEAREEKLLNTMWNAELRTLKRVRRRPLYRVVQEDTAAGISGVARDLEYPIDSTDASVNFEFSPITSEGNERLEKVASEVSYEVPELQYSNIASTGNPEVPQTLEFDQAVLSDLSIPEDNEHSFWKSVPSEDEKDEESMQNDSQTYQTADEYSYIENSNPVDYRSYFTDYTEDDTEIEGEPEFVSETRDNEGNNWYQDESFNSKDSVESEDTYVVIPDEYDNAFEDYSETNGQTETYSAQSDATGPFGATHDFSQSYISPAVYAPVAPYWLPPPYYYPDGYGSQQAFNTEHFFNRDSLESPEYVGKPLNDQNYQYFPLADSGLYAYGSPNFPGHVYDYGTDGYVYPYANVYGSPYAEKFDYDTSEVKVVTESSILNENPEAAIAGNSDYSEPEMQYWGESFSTGSPEMEEVTESAFPNKESLDNVYITSDGELGEMPSSTSDALFDENMKEAETFYLFDFDENGDEFIPDATAEVLDNIKFDSNDLFQAEEPSRRNESSGDLEGVNVGSESDSTEAQFDRKNSKRLGLSETDESEKSIDSTFQTEGTSHNENPVPSSASGTAAVNTPQTHSRRQPRSYGSNIDLSRDSRFLMDNIYSDSNFRLQDAVLAQPYGTEDASLQSNVDDGFFPRTGDAGLSRASKLSELQKRILSLKQGKLGTFKKYMNPGGKN